MTDSPTPQSLRQDSGSSLNRPRAQLLTEENAVHQAEDGGVRADAERERNDGDGGETAMLQQHAESVADVVQEGCHP